MAEGAGIGNVKNAFWRFYYVFEELKKKHFLTARATRHAKPFVVAYVFDFEMKIQKKVEQGLRYSHYLL
jgi:hypothetical protein